MEMGGKGVAELVAEHRQELVLAAVEVRQFCRLLLRLPLQAAAFADVPNVALRDVPVIHLIDVADELDLGLLAVLGLERQVVVADVAMLLQFSRNAASFSALSLNRPISHSSLPTNSSCV